MDDSLDRIYGEIEIDPAFDHLRKLDNNLVPGIGLTEFPPIMFIGEAPGAQESKQHRPFVGAAGRVLDNLLAEIPLSREQIFITNVLAYRPPKNRDPASDERKAALPYLVRQVEVVKPRIVALLGKQALATFFPKLKMSEVHGDLCYGMFVPLYHPAIVVYDPGRRGMMVSDFRRLVGHLDNASEWPSLPPTIDVTPSQQAHT